MIWLIISVIVLLCAPFLARYLRTQPTLKAGLDSFVLMTVIGLVVLTLLPEALEQGGVIALGLALVGFFLPWLSEILFHNAEKTTHRVALIVACLALVVHAGSDGAILAFAGASGDGEFIQLGIVIHRIGVAVTVWWLLRQVLSGFIGFLFLGALGLTTLLGYFFVTLVSDVYALPVFGYWGAFAAGSLLHIVMHPVESDKDSASKIQNLTGSRVGTVTGIAFLVALIATHYLQHTPMDTETVQHFHNHSVDMLLHAGTFLSPILILIVAGIFIFTRYRTGSWKAARVYGRICVPWTVFGWLSLTLVTGFFPELVPTGHGSISLFLVWFLMVLMVLIQMGARAFVTVIMSHVQTHRHAH